MRRNSMKYSIGLDIGGTKIAAGIVDQEGNLSNQSKLPSMTEDKESMFEQVVHAIETVFADFEGNKEDVLGIGVGLPGKVDRENGVAIFQNNLPWANFPLKERLKERYPEMAINIDNDVAVAAYGEYFLNHIEMDKLFTYITLSTGVALSSVLNNDLLKGHGFSGELGLIPVQADLENKELIPLEKCTSGVAIEEYGKKYFEDESITTKDVFDKYYAGDPTAEKIVKAVTKSLAYGFVSVISLLDPNQIIVGGSVAMHNPELIDLIKEELKELLIEAQQDAIGRIQLSTDPDSALIGAASRLFF